MTSEQQKTNLLKFDKDKLKSLNTYIKESDGYPVALPTLRKRLTLYGKYLESNDAGSVPFILGGKNSDYSVLHNAKKEMPAFNKITELLDNNYQMSKQVTE